MIRIIISVFMLLAGVLPASADVRIVPVMGDIELSAGEVSCPSLPSGCLLCINDENTTGDNRLIIAIGETYPFTVTTGYAAGVVRPFVIVDGVRLTPDLFPCDSYLRCGVNWSDYFTPYACNGTSPGVTYRIGSMPEVTVTGDGSTHFTIPATEAIQVPFEISVCSQFFYWGAGCDVNGSADKAWELYVPAPMNAVAVSAGDTPPMPVPASDFAMDFSSSAGGTVSVSHVPENPPVAPVIVPLNGYWDVHSDLPPGTFVVEVSFGFDSASLPDDVDPAEISIAMYDPAMETWNVLPTTVDVPGQMATATTNRFSKFVLVGDIALPTQRATWGSVKALYATDEK
jgi:hypothetical protein